MRLKIIAGNFIVVLIVGLLAYFTVRGQLAEALTKQVGARVRSSAQLFDRSWRLHALELMNHAETRAASDGLRGAFSAVGDARRKRMFEMANETAAWFEDAARGRGVRPSIVAVTDSAGVVIARDQDPNRLHGEVLSKDVPAVGRALAEGRAQHDVWLRGGEGKLMQVAVAPVRSDQGAVLGTLVVGYDLSSALAASEAQTLGAHVAFLRQDAVYSASLTGPAAAALQTSLFGERNAARTAAAVGGAGSAFEWSDDLAGDDWVGVVGGLGFGATSPVGFAVVVNASEGMALLSTANMILVLSLVGLLLVLGYGFVVGGMFLQPLEEIEEGVLAVINGNTQLRLDVESAEFGGLAYRINQLINVFTGVSESDDGPAPAGQSGEWGAAELQTSVASPAYQATAAAATGDGAAAGGGAAGVIDDPAVAGPLGAEPEAAYTARIYKEYVAAKTAAGEGVQNLTQDRFAERLARNAESLQKKHGVRLVRFVVEAKGAVVSLKPVLIR